MSGLQTLHVKISGRVQGVWFRGWTISEARRLGLDGWVRNYRDGTVEAVFCGADDVVDKMLANCHLGPPAAVVDHVIIVSRNHGDGGNLSGQGFQQRRTV